MPFRVVIIGAGGRGRHWINMTRANDDFQPIAIVDPSDSVHNIIAKDYPDLERFKSIEEASGKINADVAIVAATSFYRREICLDAISAGWHVLTEKPFALSIGDAKNIVKAGNEAGLVVSVGQNYRFSSEIGTMQKMVADGEIGNVGDGVFVRHRKRYGGNTYQKNMPHNYLWEMGVHDLDFVRFTLNLKPLRVTGFSFLPPWGDFNGETTVSALYEFENDVKVNYFGAWASHIPEFHWRIDGSKGSLRLGNGLEHGKPEDSAWSGVNQLGSFGGDNALLKELADAINNGEKTSTSGEDNLWTVAMMDAVIQSTNLGGQPVSIEDMVL